MAFLRLLNKASIQCLVACIKLYQYTLSPDHGIFKYAYGGPVCRFHPTCSEYTVKAIQDHGFAGVWMGIKRVVHCNPFNTSL